MKRLILGLALLGPAYAGNEAGSGQANPDDKDRLPIGIEVVTGYRTDYVHRGFQLAGSLIDIQAQAEIALSNEWLLDVGGYYGTATGDGDFSEVAAFFDLRYETEKWTAAFGTTWRDYQDSFFEDGFDLAPSFTWHLTKDWDLGTGIAYDTGDGGWYGHLEVAWSKPTSDNSFLSTEFGTSWTEDYYGSSGWHDLYSRVGWTYTFNRNVSVTPFVGTSIPMSSSPERNRLFGGVWFEVNF
jgi:hypothetical protein